MRILAAGGGSGGHVTPVAAVLQELKTLHPDAEIRFWCDRKFANQARNILSHVDDNLKVETVLAGKLRRYHNLSILRQLTYPPIFLRNFRDLFLVLAGFLQSLFKLIFWRPDVVFTKGGYVCLPIGLAASLLKIPLVIHDSDAHPGLTNRVLSRFAKVIATGAPLEYYSYPKSRSHYVGIPINEAFKPFNDQEKQAAKLSIGITPDRPLLVVTGGGLGAKRINELIAGNLSKLLEKVSVILISGNDNYDELKLRLPKNSPNFQLHAFISKDMATTLGAADVVVARAGATTILELAALAMPTILIPNGLLTGGHQLKNAAVYEATGAVIILDENELLERPEKLPEVIFDLVADQEKRQKISVAFSKFSKPEAARDMAQLIINAARK